MKNLNLAINAAIDAGKRIMEIYDTEDFNVEIKADDSPLTKADREANTVIMKFLEQSKLPIISEENKQTDYDTRKLWNSCWIVDPLDGTKEFIKRNGEFTVNIALIENKIPTLGVIYVPVTKVLYFTNNSKSYKIALSDLSVSVEDIIIKSTQIKVALPVTEPVKIVGSRSHLNEDTQNFIDSIKNEKEVEIVSKGSSLKFCLVAEGTAHYYPRFAPTMEWDTAAGQAICQSAGARVINQETQEPLLYNRENLLNPYFLVTV